MQRRSRKHPDGDRVHVRLRRTLPLLLALTAAASALGPRAAVATDPELGEEQLLLLQEALNVVREVGDDVWHGWSKASKTTLLIDQDREFLVNLPRQARPPRDFVRIRQEFLRRPVYTRPATLPPTLRTAFPLDGVPVAVVGAWRPDVESPNEWVVTLIEQWFHLLQLDRGEEAKVRDLKLSAVPRPSWQTDHRFPFDDPDVGNAMLLLGQSLYDFWEGARRLPREGQRDLLAGNAWAALQNLRTVITLKHGEDTYRFFQLEVWRDGVARYSSLLVAREVARAEVLAEYEHARGFNELAEHKGYARTWEENMASRFWLIRTSGLEGERDATSFDAIGHGIAELLDGVNPDWKDSYFDRGVWLDDLLAARLDAPERTTHAR